MIDKISQKPRIDPIADTKRYNITFSRPQFERFQTLIRNAGGGRETPGLIMNIFVEKAVQLLERKTAEAEREGRKMRLHEVLSLLDAKD